MKKIMIILGAYYPNPSANGICVGRIIDELLKQNHEVFCICNAQINVPMAEDLDNLHIRRVYASVNKRLAEMINNNNTNRYKRSLLYVLHTAADVAHLIKMTMSFPVASLNHAKSIFKTAEKLLVENDIDVVIGVNMPTDTLYAAYLLKEKHQNICLISYCLDPIFGGMKNRFLSKKMIDTRSILFERKMLNASSVFISQHEHKEHFEKDHKEMLDKVKFVGVPLLLEHKNGNNKSIKKNKTVLYAGALSPSTRNPAYIFEVFKHVKNAQLVMYISNGEDWVKEAANNIKNVHVFGRISHEEVLQKMDEADAFLNIGNMQTMFCPSKIVEYISYGKPIISTYRIDKDTCGYYMSKYPIGLYIDERTVKVEEAANYIDEILSNTTKELPFSDLEKLYQDNTPAYIVHLIVYTYKNKEY